MLSINCAIYLIAGLKQVQLALKLSVVWLYNKKVMKKLKFLIALVLGTLIKADEFVGDRFVTVIIFFNNFF